MYSTFVGTFADSTYKSAPLLEPLAMTVESPLRRAPQRSPRKSPQKTPQKPRDRISIALRQFSGQRSSNAAFNPKQRVITINNSTFQIPNFFSHHEFHVEHVIKFLRPTIEPFCQGHGEACVIGFGAKGAGTSWSLGSRPGSNGAIVSIFKECCERQEGRPTSLIAWLYNRDGAQCTYQLALKSTRILALQLFLEVVEKKRSDLGCDHVVFRFTFGEAQLTVVDLAAPSGAGLLKQSLAPSLNPPELVALVHHHLAKLPVAVLACVRDGGAESEEIARVLELAKRGTTGPAPRQRQKVPKFESIEVDDYGVWVRRQLSSMPATPEVTTPELETKDVLDAVPELNVPEYTEMKGSEPIKFQGFAPVDVPVSDSPLAPSAAVAQSRVQAPDNLDRDSRALEDAPAQAQGDAQVELKSELKSQNDALVAQNRELQEELAALKTLYEGTQAQICTCECAKLESQSAGASEPLDWDSDDEYLAELERTVPRGQTA